MRYCPFNLLKFKIKFFITRYRSFKCNQQILFGQVSVAELKAAKKTVLISKTMPTVCFNTRKIAKKYLKNPYK